jgi:hypothetical protein
VNTLTSVSGQPLASAEPGSNSLPPIPRQIVATTQRFHSCRRVIPMSLEKNKDIVRRVLDEFWHKGDERILDQLFAPDYVNQALKPGGHGQLPGPVLP